MAEYIDRDKVLDAVFELPSKMDEQGYGWIARVYLYNLLCDFPAADVQPVKHGKWKRKKETLGRGPMYAEIYVWECTACKGVTPVDVYKYNYCPSCGAIMDGGDF